MSDKVRYSSQVFKYYLKRKYGLFLYPFFALYYAFFSVLLPLFLGSLDWLDRERKLTVGYNCVCVK